MNAKFLDIAGFGEGVFGFRLPQNQKETCSFCCQGVCFALVITKNGYYGWACRSQSVNPEHYLLRIIIRTYKKVGFGRLRSLNTTY